MKLLICSQIELSKTLGMSRATLGLVAELRLLGWECDIVGPAEIAEVVGLPRKQPPGPWFSEALRSFLKDRAARYDVVRYDYSYLPYDRSEFPRNVVMVARSDLLGHHISRNPLPTPRGLCGFARRLIKGRKDRRREADNRDRGQKTINQADVVEVLSQYDAAELRRCGVPDQKIFVIPNGLERERAAAFEAVSTRARVSPMRVAFVGTFDYRKGARDFPALWNEVVKRFPKARLRLLGTGSGIMRTADQVRYYFPEHLRHTLEIYPRFNPEELHELLAPCWVGVFPSYLEGFPLGVLEMLAAGIPVVAYDAPGAPELLDRGHLVTCGDFSQLADKVVDLLGNPTKLVRERENAANVARRFTWSAAAAIADQEYRQRCNFPVIANERIAGNNFSALKRKTATRYHGLRTDE